MKLTFREKGGPAVLQPMLEESQLIFKAQNRLLLKWVLNGGERREMRKKTTAGNIEIETSCIMRDFFDPFHHHLPPQKTFGS